MPFLAASRTDPTIRPLRATVAGIGGYGTSHHEAFRELEARRPVAVAATCDPRFKALQDLCERFDFAARGVEVFEHFEEMMAKNAGQVDFATIATPIPLHEEMHAACVRAGVGCYIEKPPTLDPVELERMIARDRTAPRRTQVGFHYVHQPERRALKQRMMSGEFGSLQRMALTGLARRPESYYLRNNWAGRLELHGRLVLDSCCGNAFAHAVNNLLFFAGLDAMDTWSAPATIHAELYRSNAIEGADTVFARCQLDSGIPLDVAASHSCHSEFFLREKLIFERASLEIPPSGHAVISHANGRTETWPIRAASLVENLSSYIDYLIGARNRPVMLLEDSRGVTDFNALLHLAAGRIHRIGPKHAERLAGSRPAIVVGDMENAAECLAEHGKLPSESGFAWAASGGCAARKDIPDLFAAVRALQHSP